MKRIVAILSVLFLWAACLTVVAQEAKEKQDKQDKQEKEEPAGPLTGTWKCVGHAQERPDSEFQLDVEQHGEKVTGTGTNAQGSAPLAGTFKDGKFQVTVTGGEGNYDLEGTLDGNKISGTWSFSGNGSKGTFDGKKAE